MNTHVAHPCPFCGTQPDGHYDYKCPNGDPIIGGDIAEWNRHVEIITDFQDSDRTCKCCGQPITVHGDYTENNAVEYTVECQCSEASDRYPDEAICRHNVAVLIRIQRDRRMNEPDIIGNILNGKTKEA